MLRTEHYALLNVIFTPNYFLLSQPKFRVENVHYCHFNHISLLAGSSICNWLKYLQADFENYRKRVERPLTEHIQVGNERSIRNLLSILDELELSVEACKKTQNTKKRGEGN